MSSTETPARRSIDAVYEAVRDVATCVDDLGAERYGSWEPAIKRDAFRPSAKNLAAYLALREHDLRALQDDLAPLGLSSLGRCEGHVDASLRAVRSTLAVLAGQPETRERPTLRDFDAADAQRRTNLHELFGPRSSQGCNIMVTLPSEAASDSALVRRLIVAGMNSARLNCAHDDAATWRASAAHVRQAATELGKPCLIIMDLAGPKMRIATVDAQARRFARGERVRITCAEERVHAAVLPGAHVWIDDGKVHAQVVEGDAAGLLIEVIETGPKGAKIRPGDGLNFPGTALPFHGLTDKDRQDLDTVVAIADIVEQSFVRSAGDVVALIDELDRRGKLLPIVAKIETADAITQLPEIIVAGSGRLPFGAMIARGDLAVEIGYQRLAEMQEELLWICEAAHVPVVWATQVLDRLVRKGVPSRAEITDAAMAEQADCVMLNKGPFLVEAVTVLGDVLRRMQAHQRKKSSRLRALRSWPSSGLRHRCSFEPAPPAAG